MRKFEETYVAIWCTLMPITGTLLIPAIQGTIPAYMMAFGSVLLVYMKVQSGEIPQAVLSYCKTFLSVALLWLFLMISSQMVLMITERHDFGDVNMMDPNDDRVLFRRTLFTQSLYLLACVLLALYFRYFFKARWMRYVYWGGYLLAGYGIYEWLFYLIFHKSGDFLVNRTFGDHTASWSQNMSFGGFTVLRIKSTLGEPTFFAAVVIPYLFLALEGRKKVLSAMLLFTAVFSTSTALYLALPFVLFIKSFWTGRIRWDYLTLLVLVGAFIASIAIFFPDSFRGMFMDKFNGDNDSGATRQRAGLAVRDLYASFNLPNWLFGIGFGYAYLGVPDQLLVNTGIIGMLAFLWAFGRVVWLLPTTEGCEGLKAGILAILVLCVLSLSELYLPTTWMFLGLAYFRLAEYRKAQLELASSPPEDPRAQFYPTGRPPAAA